jgi:8-oxo-dGTP diphosphatase
MTTFNFEIHHRDLFPDRQTEKSSEFSERPTVKVLLMDEHDDVCLIAKTGSGFYFLPGGGIEKDENEVEALKRECLEEAGCAVSVGDKIGTVMEHRDEVSEKRTVACFIARVSGEKKPPTLAPEDEGFDVIWVSREKAIFILEKQLESISEETSNFYARKFNSARDSRILQSS